MTSINPWATLKDIHTNEGLRPLVEYVLKHADFYRKLLLMDPVPTGLTAGKVYHAGTVHHPSTIWESSVSQGYASYSVFPQPPAYDPARSTLEQRLERASLSRAEGQE